MSSFVFKRKQLNLKENNAVAFNFEVSGSENRRLHRFLELGRSSY